MRFKVKGTEKVKNQNLIKNNPILNDLQNLSLHEIPKHDTQELLAALTLAVGYLLKNDNKTGRFNRL